MTIYQYLIFLIGDKFMKFIMNTKMIYNKYFNSPGKHQNIVSKNINSIISNQKGQNIDTKSKLRQGQTHYLEIYSQKSINHVKSQPHLKQHKQAKYPLYTQPKGKQLNPQNHQNKRQNHQFIQGSQIRYMPTRQYNSPSGNLKKYQPLKFHQARSPKGSSISNKKLDQLILQNQKIYNEKSKIQQELRQCKELLQKSEQAIKEKNDKISQLQQITAIQKNQPSNIWKIKKYQQQIIFLKSQKTKFIEQIANLKNEINTLRSNKYCDETKLSARTTSFNKDQISVQQRSNMNKIQDEIGQNENIFNFSRCFQKQLKKLSQMQLSFDKMSKMMQLALVWINISIENQPKVNDFINQSVQRLCQNIILDIDKTKSLTLQGKDIKACAYSTIISAKIKKGQKQSDIEKYVQLALEIYNSNIQLYFEEKICILNNLALFYEAKGRRKDSIAKYKQILDLMDVYYPQNDDRKLLAFNNLGSSYYEQAKVGKTIFEKALFKSNFNKGGEVYRLVQQNYKYYQQYLSARQ